MLNSDADETGRNHFELDVREVFSDLFSGHLRWTYRVCVFRGFPKVLITPEIMVLPDQGAAPAVLKENGAL